MNHVFETIVGGGSLLCAICSAICAIWVATRDGKWRETEDAKALVAAVNAHTQSLPLMSEAIASLEATTIAHGKRLAAGEERFNSLATKEDVAGVKAEVRSLEKTIDKVDGAVTRIENILMDRNP